MNELSINELTKSIHKKFYNVKELAEILGVSKGLIYESVYRHKIPCKRIGRRILIPYDFVERMFLQ